MGRYNVAYATGSRADYGIVRHYLKKLEQDTDIDLKILVTGALLSEEFGYQVDLIKQDGFSIGVNVALSLKTASTSDIIHSMAEALGAFGRYFEENRYDLLILLGDRYEILSVALAAAMQRIPILHLHGGEATYGNYDEFIRHSITKMARFHFTSTEEYRRRVVQLGESPEKVYCLGALGAENCLDIDEANIPDGIKKMKLRKYAVVLFHPETLTDVSPLQQVKELLNALEQSQGVGIQYVFLGSNADTHSNEIREAIKGYVERGGSDRYFENLPTNVYHYLVKNALFIIGNSSSGIIEAPSLGTWTINIGDRQKGRVRGESVKDVQCISSSIQEAINSCVNSKAPVFSNPYYKENACDQYYHMTKNILRELSTLPVEPKTFYDMPLTLKNRSHIHS